MTRFPILLAMISIAVPAVAPAQDMAWSTIIPSVTGTDVLGMTLRDKMAQQEQQRRSPRRADAVPARPAPPPQTINLRYVPSKERRTANIARFVAKTRAADPKGADGLARIFAAKDMIEAMRAPLAKYRLRIDDVADAYTVWWVGAWQASHGTNDDISAGATAAVRGQVVQAMRLTGALVRAGDAAKQELAESLLIQAMLLSAAVDQAKGNPRQLAAVGNAAVQGARGMGVDLRGMTLTEAGFVPGRR